jgi:hypothetical protein
MHPRREEQLSAQQRRGAHPGARGALEGMPPRCAPPPPPPVLLSSLEMRDQNPCATTL